MATRTEITTPIPEATTPILAATFVDEDGTTIASLTTLTMTLYDSLTRAIINARSQADVSASQTAGVLALTLAAADTVILQPNAASERHVALFEFTWGVGRVGKHEVSHQVVNLSKVGP